MKNKKLKNIEEKDEPEIKEDKQQFYENIK